MVTLVRHIREWPATAAKQSMSSMLRRTLIGSFVALLLAAPAGAGTIVVRLALVPGKLAVKAAPAPGPAPVRCR